MADLRELWDRAVQAGQDRRFVYGRLGKADSSGSVSLVVTGRPNHLFVSLGSEGDQGVTTAINAGAPRIPWVPIRLREERGQLYIEGLDYTPGRLEAFFNQQTAPGGAGFHDHRIGSGLEYEVEALRLEPGRVVPTTGMIVSVNAFRYYYKGVWDTWGAGSTLDLTPYKPASGKWAWVVVGVNPATNVLVAVKGTDQAAQTDLTTALIDSVSFSDYIPCGAVQIAESDTVVTDITRWQDAHGWVNMAIDELDDLTDVTIASEVENDSFWYDGSGWVNGPGHRVNMGVSNTLTLSSDTLTISGLLTIGMFAIKGEGSVADDLVTIVGGVEGDIIVLRKAPGSFGSISIKTGDNIIAGDDFVLNTATHIMVMILTSAGWMPWKVNHSFLLDLNSDDHTQYLLLTGRSGGQVAKGGTGASDNLELESTSHATKGYLLLQTNGGNVGIGEVTPSNLLHLYGTNPAIRFEDSAASGIYALIHADNLNGVLYYDAGVGSSGGHYFQSDGTLIARITSTGRLRLYDAAGGIDYDLGPYGSHDGMVLRATTNPSAGGSLLTVMSSGGSERFHVEHAGATYVNGKLGINKTSPEMEFQTEKNSHGFGVFSLASVNATEQTILTGAVNDFLVGDILGSDGTNWNKFWVELVVPITSYNTHVFNIGILGPTIEFRLYSNGDFTAVRISGATAPDVSGWINYH